MIRRLRELALTVSPAEVGVPEDAGIWAVVMEIEVSGETATLVGMADGTASLYISSGGGIIGGGDHEVVRAAAQGLVEVAQRADTAAAEPAPDDLPYSAAGSVRFYFRSGSLTTTAEVTEEAVADPDHALHDVFASGHRLLEKLRLAVESQQADDS